VRLEDKTWRVEISKVRLGRDEYRVIRPARPIAHAVLFETWHGVELTVDKAATVDLAMAWAVAARSPRSLVYLPVRSSNPNGDHQPDTPRLDLVLAHHSLGFRPSHWKQVRARLGRGLPHKVDFPPRALPTITDEEHVRAKYPRFRDHLHWNVVADTLFVVGSRHAFDLSGEDVRALAEEGPANVARTPDVHCCAEIPLGAPGHWRPSRRRPYAELHVEYCALHR